MLRKNWFSLSWPQYMNYAGIGQVIAHEISHAFDKNSAAYDFERKPVAWSKATKKAFDEKVQCLIDQYGNFTEPITNKKWNSFSTIGDDMADNTGYLLSYLAYQKVSVKDELIENSKYTKNQLFWISSAQNWCESYSKEFMEKIMKNNEILSHSPERFRALGPLINIKEFSNDFNCPIGSPMNPKKKCKVW
jgi:neprilysin